MNLAVCSRGVQFTAQALGYANLITVEVISQGDFPDSLPRFLRMAIMEHHKYDADRQTNFLLKMAK